MVHCCRMRPLHESSVARTLVTVATELDGHPLLDSVYFHSEGEDDIVVLCTLSPFADSERYGFGEEHSVEVCSSSHIMVHRRGRRSFPLMLSPRDVSDTLEYDSSRCSPLRIDQMFRVKSLPDRLCFPNFPTLTVDVQSRFDRKMWKSV